MHDEHAALINAAAQANDLDPHLLHAVVDVESRGNPRAVSRAGAKGLMQINPITQRHLGIKDPFNPEENLQKGAGYLASLIAKYGQDEGLRAYNAGPRNRNKGFPETTRYESKVRDQLAALKAAAPQSGINPPDTPVYAPTDVGFSNPLATAGRLMGF
jgi:soluble lytic murein transglycosylase-like protein